MRSKKLVLFAVIAAAPLLVGAETVFDDQCETGEGGGSTRWLVGADWIGTVNCSSLEADPTGGCTAVQYTVQTNPGQSGNKNISHAAVLVYNPPPYEEITAAWTSSGSNTVYFRCVGDSATDTGIGTCHEQAVRVNANGDKTATWWVAVPGVRQMSTTTVTVKGQSEGRCSILGVGDEVDENVLPAGCVPSCGNFDPDQQILKSEIVQFDECFVQFDFNLFTGEIVDFYQPQLCDPNDSGCCDVSLGCAGDGDCCDPDNQTFDLCDAFEVKGGVEALDLTVTLEDELGAGQNLGDVPFGFGNFGDGYLSTGDDSCTCRMFAGRVFCWGSPCPAYSARGTN